MSPFTLRNGPVHVVRSNFTITARAISAVDTFATLMPPNAIHQAFEIDAVPRVDTALDPSTDDVRD